MRSIITVLMLSLTYTSFSQTSFKHDIGLKLSTYQPESFQLQYRYHLNEKWAFSASAHFGIRSTYNDYGAYVSSDSSTYELRSTEFRFHTYGIDFGAIRKLNFMKHNYYYVGGNAGVGAITRVRHNSRTLYEPNTDSGFSNSFFPLHPLIGEILESEYNVAISNAMNVKARLFTGLDVPIVDRLIFNFELGLLFDMQFSGVDQFAILQIPGYLTGGLRYNFGKIE